MKAATIGLALSLTLAAPSFAHRLDEYLQAALISVDKDRMQAQLRLAPGVAVVPLVLAAIDTNADGIISDSEQQAYAARVLGDLSLAMDGQTLKPRLLSLKFPTLEEFKEGRGEIQLELEANLPPGESSRKLTWKNRHFSGIAAYLVNCLIPRDPGMRVITQNRNYSQSFYELNYVHSDVGSGWWRPDRNLLVMVALALSVRLVWLLWRRLRMPDLQSN